LQKTLFFILFLVTAICTFTPCCVDECDESISAQEHGHKDEKSAACSPFFACGTCPCYVEVARPIQFAEPLVDKNEYPSEIGQSYFFTYSSSFWQPPRNC
jgi:hypothetical protein